MRLAWARQRVTSLTVQYFAVHGGVGTTPPSTTYPIILSNKAHHVYERLLSWSQFANELQDLQQQLLSLMTFLTAGAITTRSKLV